MDTPDSGRVLWIGRISQPSSAATCGAGLSPEYSSRCGRLVVVGDVFDIAVVGAGPAGSVAAYAAARRGLRVALIDRQTFPRDKACGDGIGPGATALKFPDL